MALSRAGRRALDFYDLAIPGRQHRGLRYNLQYGLPMTNPQLASAWRRDMLADICCDFEPAGVSRSIRNLLACPHRAAMQRRERRSCRQAAILPRGSVIRRRLTLPHRHPTITLWEDGARQ